MSELELVNFFDNIIKADSNPFTIISKETFKEDEEIKVRESKKIYNLQLVESPIDLIMNNQNIEVMDYYPKTFFKKLFNIKSPINLEFMTGEQSFVLASEKTQKLIKTDAKVYTISEDDKIIIGKRDSLILLENEKTWAFTNQDNYKTILLK